MRGEEFEDTEQVHGNLSEARRRSLPFGLLDLAVNTNPFGPPEGVLRAMEAARIGIYPDTHAEGLVELWGPTVCAAATELFFGAGAVDLIWAAVRAFCGPERPLAVLEPTFSEPAAAAAAASAVVREVRIEPGAAISADALAARMLAGRRPGLVYVCAPNNPTGETRSDPWLRRLANALAPTPLLVDESFHSVARDRSGASGAQRLAAPPLENMVRLRSLTKDFGMPGVRLGYGTAPAPFADRIRLQLTPWRISAAAQQVGQVLLEGEALRFLEASAVRWQAATDEVKEALEERGHRVARGSCPFLLVEVGDARSTRQGLLDHGIHVRDCTSFGLSGHIRVAGRPDASRRLVAALDALGLPYGEGESGGPAPDRIESPPRRASVLDAAGSTEDSDS